MSRTEAERRASFVVELDGTRLADADREGLRAGVARGQVFHVRGALQAIGLLEAMNDASFEGVGRSEGPEVEHRLRSVGFEHLHEVAAGIVAGRLDVAHGTIRAVSDKLCPEHTEAGEVVVLKRYCPHQGADLGAGYLEASTLRCPWHNLPTSTWRTAPPRAAR